MDCPTCPKCHHYNAMLLQPPAAEDTQVLKCRDCGHTISIAKCEWCDSLGKVYNCEGTKLCKACACEFYGDDSNETYRELYEQEKKEGYL